MAYRHKALGSLIMVIISLLLLFCCSCSANEPIAPDSQAYAYLEIFKQLTNLNDSAEEEIAVNLTDVSYENPSQIKKLIEEYAKEYDVSIIWNTNRDRYDSFDRAYLLIFEDVELTEKTLTSDVTLMLAAILASTNMTYTVEKEAGVWTIQNVTINLIS